MFRERWSEGISLFCLKQAQEYVRRLLPRENNKGAREPCRLRTPLLSSSNAVGYPLASRLVVLGTCERTVKFASSLFVALSSTPQQWSYPDDSRSLRSSYIVKLF